MQKLKKIIVLFLVTFLAIFVFLSLSLLMLTLSFNANIKTTPDFDHHDIIQLKKELSQSNPFKYQRNGSRVINISEKNANQGTQVLLSGVLSSLFPDIATRDIPTNIRFHNGYASVSTSPMISIFSLKLFSNISFSISFDFKQQGGDQQIIFSDAFIGHLPIPDSFFTFFYPQIKTALFARKPEYAKLFSSIKKIDITEKRISIHYRWDRRFANQAQKMSKNILFTAEEQKLIAIYYEELSKIPRFYWRIPTDIHKIIRPLFNATKQRIKKGHEPIVEIKATFLTLGIFASGIRINRLIKGKNNRYLRHLPYGRLMLSGRSDLMRHFLISAALTVSTNKILADTIGLSKEINDANTGSGFSFDDLLADRAGTALAKMATSPSTAIQFLDRITDPAFSASDYMPVHDDLPESIPASNFKQNYADANNKKYRTIEDIINQRISTRPIYRNLSEPLHKK